MHDYCIKPATPDDLDGARVVMLDAVHRDFATGYVPRWHRDIIDPETAYLAPARHTLLVATDGRDGSAVATAALDSRGPAYPPNPRWLAERYPSGETAQLRRVYVRPEHRRRGPARRLDGNGTAVPAIAESWSAEKGGLSRLFTLRDAKFQDGTE